MFAKEPSGSRGDGQLDSRLSHVPEASLVGIHPPREHMFPSQMGKGGALPIWLLCFALLPEAHRTGLVQTNICHTGVRCEFQVRGHSRRSRLCQKISQGW